LNRMKAIALAVFFLVMTVAVVAGFAAGGLRPEVASAHGARVDTVVDYVLCSSGVIFVIGHAVLFWFLVRYSGSVPVTYVQPSSAVQWRWALGVAFGMALVSEVGVLVLGLPVWAEVYGEPPADVLDAEVVGVQFNWLIRYPGKDGVYGRTDPKLVAEWNPLGLDEDDPKAADDIVLPNGRLVLPVDRMARLSLRSHDVLHSFSVPQFRTKQDLIPGFVAHTQFRPTKVGTYEIACAELCGLGHYRMRGTVVVMSQEDFAAWLAKQVGYYEGG